MKTYTISRRDNQTGKQCCKQEIRARSVELAKDSFATKCGCTLETLSKNSYLYVESVK